MNAAAAAAAATTAGAGSWLFDYNRANFQFDQGMRFGRFTAARGFANAQVGQYREDIAGITGVTQAKMDTWTTVSTLFLCVCAALSDAGRIGMHGCAPPGWLCALYSGNIFTSVMYCGLALWLSMHGSLRAQCAAVSLKTRKVRLPIPSMEQLDRARNFGSAFEKQEWNDIFRVPFARHAQWGPDSLPAEDEPAKDGAENKNKKAAPAAGSDGFGSTARSTVPSWIRDEQVVDKGEGTGMPFEVDIDDVLGDHDDHEQPEHFKMLQAAQEDWYCYDIYARVAMLYGTCHFLYAVTYYSIGTTMAELRGFWISWSLPLLFMCAQALILRLDILHHSKQKVLPNMEWVGHTAPYWAVLGTTLEYRWTYNPATIIVTWVFVTLCFAAHLIMALRFLDLAWPDSHHLMEMDDRTGKEWWPRHWSVPSAFSKAMWLLAPPKKLEQGQSCLLHEMADLSNIGGGVKCRRRKKAKNRGRGKSVTAQELLSQDKLIKEKFAAIHKSEAKTEQVQVNTVYYNKWEPIHRKIMEIVGPEAMSYGANGHSDLGERDGKRSSARDIDMKIKEVGNLVEILEEDWVKYQMGFNKADPEINTAGQYAAGSLFHDVSMKGKRPANLPWQLMRVAICTSCICWFYMMIVTICEAILGPESLMKPPGEPPWIRDTKRRWYQEGWVHTSRSTGYPQDYKLWTAAVAHYPEHGGSHERRLQDRNETLEIAYSALLKALPKLSELASTAEVPQPTEHPFFAQLEGLPAREPELIQGGSFAGPELRSHPVRWPNFFEPKLLAACPAGESVAALTPRGFGAIAKLANSDQVEAVPFSLDGVSELGPLAGASWTARGLELVTKHGLIVLCPGSSPNRHGVWACATASPRPLPVPEGATAIAAAVTELVGPEAKRVAAMVLDSLPGIVAILEHESDSWKPVGQVHLPEPTRPHALAFSGHELLALSRHGEVLRKHLRDGRLSRQPAPAGPHAREYHAVGELPRGGLLRLALHQAGDGAPWNPELLRSE